METEPTAIDLEVADLVLAQRWAALAVVQDGAPVASMVAYAAEEGLEALVLFLSGLAVHTGALLRDPRASLAVTTPDSGRGDPQTLRRVSLAGRAIPVDRDAPEFERAWRAYEARFPEASPRLALGDFVLFRFFPESARYVGGFARAVSLGGDRLGAAARARRVG